VAATQGRAGCVCQRRVRRDAAAAVVGSGDQGEDRRGRGIGERGSTGGDKKQRECVTGGSHNVLVGIKLKFEGR
jgi:hypothetical protein